MTLEESVEWIISEGCSAIKKQNRNTVEGYKLERHEPVERYGQTFRCWMEFAVYKTAMQLQEWCPELSLEVELAGNDSTLKIDFEDKEQRRQLNKAIHMFFEQCRQAGIKIA